MFLSSFWQIKKALGETAKHFWAIRNFSAAGLIFRSAPQDLAPWIIRLPGFTGPVPSAALNKEILNFDSYYRFDFCRYMRHNMSLSWTDETQTILLYIILPALRKIKSKNPCIIRHFVLKYLSICYPSQLRWRGLMPKRHGRTTLKRALLFHLICYERLKINGGI